MNNNMTRKFSSAKIFCGNGFEGNGFDSILNEEDINGTNTLTSIFKGTQ